MKKAWVNLFQPFKQIRYKATQDNSGCFPVLKHSGCHPLFLSFTYLSLYQNEVTKTVESSLLEGVEVNMEVVTLKKGGKENRDSASSNQASSSNSSSTSSATPSQAKQGERKAPDGKMYSEG